jgi:hypothetical protein
MPRTSQGEKWATDLSHPSQPGLSIAPWLIPCNLFLSIAPNLIDCCLDIPCITPVSSVAIRCITAHSLHPWLIICTLKSRPCDKLLYGSAWLMVRSCELLLYTDEKQNYPNLHSWLSWCQVLGYLQNREYGIWWQDFYSIRYRYLGTYMYFRCKVCTVP